MDRALEYCAVRLIPGGERQRLLSIRVAARDCRARPEAQGEVRTSTVDGMPMMAFEVLTRHRPDKDEAFTHTRTLRWTVPPLCLDHTCNRCMLLKQKTGFRKRVRSLPRGRTGGDPVACTQPQALLLRRIDQMLMGFEKNTR